jgi:hypothetical protein
VKIRKRANSRPKTNLLRQSSCLADEEVCAWKLVGRLEIHKHSVLADPRFLDAEFIRDDDLMEIFIIGNLRHLIQALSVRKESDTHDVPLIGS